MLTDEISHYDLISFGLMAHRNHNDCNRLEFFNVFLQCWKGFDKTSSHVCLKPLTVSVTAVVLNLHSFHIPCLHILKVQVSRFSSLFSQYKELIMLKRVSAGG